MGCDVGIVAPLRGVADGNEESLLLDTPVVGVDDVGGRFVVGYEFAEATKVSERASCTCLGKLGRNLCIKAHTCRTEEDVAIDRAVIDLDAVAIANAFERLGDVEGQLQVACEAIAASHRDDAELNWGANQGTAGLVDGAIATDGDHSVDSPFNSPAGQLTGMTGIFGESDVNIEPIFWLQNLMHKSWYLVFWTNTGNGIYDD